MGRSKRIFIRSFQVFLLGIVFLLSGWNGVFAQDSPNKLTIHKNPWEVDFQQGLFIRGKAIGGFFLEDWWMANICIGLEYRFRKTNSVGLDYVMMEHFFERDTFDYINQYESSFGYTNYDLRNNFILDYRKYSEMKELKDGNYLSFYGSLFLRYGNRRIFNEKGWHYGENDMIYAKYYFYDLGTSLGIHYAFGSSGFGFDTQIGVFARSQKVHEQIYHFDRDAEIKELTDPIKVKPIFRFNFYYLFGSQKYRRQLPK